MSHGKKGNIILDVDKKPVDLATIYKPLSPANFPAMAGKPKMVIIQACSGGKNSLLVTLTQLNRWFNH